MIPSSPPAHECVAFEKNKLDTHAGHAGARYVFVISGEYIVVRSKGGEPDLIREDAGDTIPLPDRVLGEKCQGFEEIKKQILLSHPPKPSVVKKDFEDEE